MTVKSSAVRATEQAPSKSGGLSLRRALAVAAVRVGPGDAVVVEHPERPGFEMVKRVVAAPGGRRLGPDEVWVEGDDPGASTDSRTFGPVAARSVAARVVLVLWPPRRWGSP